MHSQAGVVSSLRSAPKYWVEVGHPSPALLSDPRTVSEWDNPIFRGLVMRLTPAGVRRVLNAKGVESVTPVQTQNAQDVLSVPLTPAAPTVAAGERHRDGSARLTPGDGGSALTALEVVQSSDGGTTWAEPAGARA